MFPKFRPQSPDPFMQNGMDAADAKFGHLNAVIDYINAVPPGGGIESVTGSAVDNTDPLNPVINIDGEFLPTAGGTMDEGATINFNSGARLQEGTSDAGLGGNGGIALRCSIDYELKWEAGRLFVMHQDGFIIREVRYTGITTPTEFDDVTIGFVENSRWVLDNGDTYVCNDPTEDAADWQFIFNNQLSITDVDGQAIIIAEASRAIKIQGPSGTFQGLKYRNDYSAEYQPLSLIARQDAPKIFALDGKPTNTATIPSNYGDIYFDKLSGNGYFATGISSDTDWEKLNDFSGSYYNPTQFPPVLAQPISFGKFFWTKIGKIINAKGIVTIEFGGIYAHQSNFKFTIPYMGAANISGLFGSITGYGLVTINHKIIHTRLSGDLTINLDESVDLTIEVDNSMDGSCSFVLDFTYELS